MSMVHHWKTVEKLCNKNVTVIEISLFGFTYRFSLSLISPLWRWMPFPDPACRLNRLHKRWLAFDATLMLPPKGLYTWSVVKPLCAGCPIVFLCRERRHLTKRHRYPWHCAPLGFAPHPLRSKFKLFEFWPSLLLIFHSSTDETPAVCGQRRWWQIHAEEGKKNRRKICSSLTKFNSLFS